MQVTICKVEGCCKEANRKGHQLCEMHYGRLRRNGTYENIVRPELIKHSHGYLLQAVDNGRREYQHRLVYSMHYGNGPFACYWCGKVSEFEDMHVDHVDANRTNNHIDNLVASCPACNQARGRSKMMETFRDKFGIEFNGQKRTWNEWAKHLGISRNALLTRLANGWPLDRVLTEGKSNRGPKKRQGVGNL